MSIRRSRIFAHLLVEECILEMVYCYGVQVFYGVQDVT